MQRPILLCLMALLCAIVSRAQITSTFDSDADGWTVFFGASGASLPATHNATGGNPDGHASLTYASATNSVQSWIAPAKFRGNKVVRSLGMNLRFDLQQSIASTNPGVQGDVRIESTAGTIIFVFSVADRPTTSWRSYTIKLDETAGWRWNSTTGALATRSQVKAVLGDIDALEIAASYAQNAAYTARIDNVVLEEKALGIAPVITSFSPTNASPGSVVTINGTSFDPTATNNAVFFSGIEANIVSASPTALEVEVPIGAGYGAITMVNKATGLRAESLSAFTPTFANGGRLIPSSFNRRVDVSITGVTNLNGLTTADVDGDGWMDVLASESGNTISIFRNLGTGGDLTASSFAPKFSLTGAGNSSGLELVDLDGDGKNDVVGHYESGSLTYFATFRNTSTPGNLSFEAGEFWYGLVYSGSFSAVLDVDGDGRADLIGQHGNGSVSPDLWIAQNISTPGDIEFGVSQSFFGGSTLDAGAGVAYGDLDNDGKPEMIVEHSFGGQIQIIQNTSAPGVISFGTPFPINEGLNGGVVVADINADGRNDLLFKQGSSNDDVNIRLNTYTSGLLSASDFATTVILNTDINNYGGVSVADLNGDGKLDILATDSYNFTVFENIYTGGAFGASSFIPGYLHEGVANSTYPTTPIACDFNGDGKPDVLVGITNTNPIRLGFFQNTNVIAPVISLNTISPLKGPAGSIVTITGDNFSTTPAENIVLFGSIKANVVSATKTALTVEVPEKATYGYVSVTRNELTSRYHLPFAPTFSPGRTIDATSFGPPVDFSMPVADFDIDAGDMDGDGKVDILVEAGNRGHTFRNVYTSGAITSSSLEKNDTTFGNAQNPKLIDINGDGKLDIASINGIYRNITSSGYIDLDPLVTAGQTTNIGIGDFNKDGRLDWAGGTTGPVQFYENRSRPGAFLTGTFGTVSPVFTSATSGSPVAAAVADFDNDGFPDIAAPVTTSVDYITFLRNTQQGKISAASFTTGQNINTLDLPGRAYEADLDVDGRMDVMIYYQGAGTNGNVISIFHNQSTGPGDINFVQQDFTLGAITGTAGTIGGPSTIADLDGDGKPEIIVTSASTNASRQGFYIFKNNTTPGTINASSFASSGLIPLSTARAVAAADINGDRKPELIFTRTNTVSVLENLITAVTIAITTQPSDNSLCPGTPVVIGVAASGEASLQYQWQALVGATFTNISDNSVYSGTTTSSLTISNLASSTTYRVRVSGSFATALSSSATVTVNTAPAAPVANGNTGCAGTQVGLTASGASDGQYRWYDVASGGTAFPGEVNSSFTTPSLSATTSYFVAVNNGTCESTRTEAIATITAVTPPATTPSSRCGSGVLTLVASGATDGQYRWYDVPSGGTALPGEVNSSFTTPALSATTSYFAAVSNGTCESARTEAIATINSAPAKPVITSNIPAAPPGGSISICAESVILSAPAGLSYVWSTGATTQSISLSGAAAAGNYTVQVIDANNCISEASDPVTIVVSPTLCSNPPTITPEPVEAEVEGSVSISLSDIVSDADGDVELSSAVIVSQPTSGAIATISNGELTIDYSGRLFSGTDRLRIRVCDSQNNCTEEEISIEVVGDIVVYDAISPNGDGKNEFFFLQYIDILSKTQQNKVSIFNRWGDVVFQTANYNNGSNSFRGLNNGGTELPSGTYFYKIEFTGQNAPPMKTGYLTLKR